MYSIYFKDNTARTVNIELPDLLEAQHYWDRLSHVFYMVSTRPTDDLDITSPSLGDDPYWKELFEVTK